MENTTGTKEEQQRISGRIPGLSDSELKTALKKRKLYQPEAAKMLVDEAIRRRIIHSEQDLLSPDFNVPEPGFSLFPVPDSRSAREKIIRSLMRSIMIVAVMPVYYGIMKFTIAKYPEGSAMISLGLIWIALAWFIMEKQERKLITPMIVITVLSMLYAGRILFYIGHLKWTDVFVPAVLWIFILYALFYTRILLHGIKSPGNL